jgi:alkylation response protein AidB-like acyl-CoA dehydrogenase
VATDAYASTDGGWAADLCFDDVRLAPESLVGEPGAPIRGALQTVLGEGIVWHAWEASGAIQALLEETTAYTGQRRQFGQALAGFQVVQHRLAEMAVHATEAQAACELATLKLMTDPGAASLIAAAAMNKVGRAAREVAQQAVQLHGAMGVCEELPVAATFRQLLAFEHRSGGLATHAVYLGKQLHAGGAHAHSQTLGVAA